MRREVSETTQLILDGLRGDPMEQAVEYILEHFSGRGLALIYSFVYNGVYMIPEIILTAIVAALIYRIPAITRRLNGQ